MNLSHMQSRVLEAAKDSWNGQLVELKEAHSPPRLAFGSGKYIGEPGESKAVFEAADALTLSGYLRKSHNPQGHRVYVLV